MSWLIICFVIVFSDYITESRVIPSLVQGPTIHESEMRFEQDSFYQRNFRRELADHRKFRRGISDSARSDREQEDVKKSVPAGFFYYPLPHDRNA